MRGFIPAAGFGKRLLPITKDTPKPLGKVGGDPLISLVYKKLISAGVRSVGINFSHLALKGIDFARRQLPHSLHIYRESTPIGAFGGVNNFIKNLSSESLLVHNGDIFFDGAFDGIVGKGDLLKPGHPFQNNTQFLNNIIHGAAPYPLPFRVNSL